VGNKKDAGLFLKGHKEYHEDTEDKAEYYGGV
jgi:hypothetical protein